MLFRAKPTIVEAKKIPPEPKYEELVEIFQWLKDTGLVQHWGQPGGDRFDLYSANTRIRANFGDWVVKDSSGSFSVCKPDIFSQTYEWIGPKAYADAPYLVN